MIVKNNYKGQQKRADDKEQRNRDEHRGRAIPQLQVEVDWQGWPKTKEEESSIEIFKVLIRCHYLRWM